LRSLTRVCVARSTTLSPFLCRSKASCTAFQLPPDHSGVQPKVRATTLLRLAGLRPGEKTALARRAAVQIISLEK